MRTYDEIKATEPPVEPAWTAECERCGGVTHGDIEPTQCDACGALLDAEAHEAATNRVLERAGSMSAD